MQRLRTRLRASASTGAPPSLSLDFLGLNQTLDSRVTFSRGSNATLVDSTGKVTYAPNNLFTQSEFANGVTDAPTRAGLVSATTFSGLTGTTGLAFGYDGTTLSYAYKSGSVSGTNYVLSVFVRMGDGNAPVFTNSSVSNSGNTFALVVGGTPVDPLTYTVTNIGGGLYRVSTASVAGATAGSNGVAKYATNNSRTFKVSGYQLEAVTYQTAPSTYNATTASAYYGPRFDYDPVTLQQKGLLIEEQRSNLLTYSEQFDNAAWSKGRVTVTANAATSPDGTSSAEAVVPDTALGSHQVFQIVTTTATATAYSVYAKANGYNWIALGFSDSGATVRQTYFNVSTGAVGVVGTGVTASITPVGNGWYRCVATIGTALAGSNTCRIYATNANGSTDFTGDGTSGIYIWGAQLEAGSFATSYIPTVASTVTRSADIASMTGTNFSDWYNQSEGALLVEYTLTAATASAIKALAVTSDGTSNNRVYVYVGNTGVSAGLVATSGVVQANPTNSAISSGVTVKTALAYKTDDFALATNGGAVATDTSGSIPTVNRLDIGWFSATSGNQANGHIRRLAYYPTRLANYQLQGLTA